MNPARDGIESRVRVALVDCTGLLGEIILRTLNEQSGMDVVATLGADALDATSLGDADIVVWNDADEGAVAQWLGGAHPAPRVLATLGDGRNASLWQLKPRRTELGSLSPAVLVDTIRTGAPAWGTASGSGIRPGNRTGRRHP